MTTSLQLPQCWLLLLLEPELRCSLSSRGKGVVRTMDFHLKDSPRKAATPG